MNAEIYPLIINQYNDGTLFNGVNSYQLNNNFVLTINPNLSASLYNKDCKLYFNIDTNVNSSDEYATFLNVCHHIFNNFANFVSFCLLFKNPSFNLVSDKLMVKCTEFSQLVEFEPLLSFPSNMVIINNLFNDELHKQCYNYIKSNITEKVLKSMYYDFCVDVVHI